MIPVRIKLPLYIRSGAGTSFSKMGIVQPSGKVIMMDGVEMGQTLKGRDQWYFKVNEKQEKQWYWSGRVEEVSVKENLIKFDPDKMSWAHDSAANGGLGIVDLWNAIKVRGGGVKVAIIDSGIGEGIADLTNVSTKIYVANDGGTTSDALGHGTLTAGVIGAKGHSIAYGIAPEAELIIIKREGIDGLLSEEIDFFSLRAVGVDIDILNISSEFVSSSERISNELTRIADQGTFVVVASGDGLSKLNNNIFPANHPNVIPVTALDKTGQLYFQALFNNNTKWILPGEQIRSCDLNGNVGFHDATSAAAPIMAGLLALFISFKKKGSLLFTYGQLFQQLENTSKLVLFNDGNNKHTFFLPDPLKAFVKLKFRN